MPEIASSAGLNAGICPKSRAGRIDPHTPPQVDRYGDRISDWEFPVGRGGLHDSEDAAMRNPFRGLRIGGRIRRHHVAEKFAIPIASLHRPENTCWSWSLDFFRYRPETGFKNWFLRVNHSPGCQANTHVWVFGIGAFRFVRQAWANEPRYRRAV